VRWVSGPSTAGEAATVHPDRHPSERVAVTLDGVNTQAGAENGVSRLLRVSLRY